MAQSLALRGMKGRAREKPREVEHSWKLKVKGKRRIRVDEGSRGR
jgi:hypothetical protein